MRVTTAIHEDHIFSTVAPNRYKLIDFQFPLFLAAGVLKWHCCICLAEISEMWLGHPHPVIQRPTALNLLAAMKIIQYNVTAHQTFSIWRLDSFLSQETWQLEIQIHKNVPLMVASGHTIFVG